MVRARDSVGRMRHRINLYMPAGTSLPGGEIDPDAWLLYRRKVPCDILDLAGNEVPRGLEVDATMSHRIRMRYDRRVNPEMRVEFRGQSYGIVSVSREAGRERYLILILRSQR